MSYYNDDYEVPLASLVGKNRKLEGFDMEGAVEDDAGRCRFMLDGQTYVATENPDDGYRSLLGNLQRHARPPKNMFPACEVDVELVEETLLRFKDHATGETVLEIGTDNYDDYYPVCVMRWHPECMR